MSKKEEEKKKNRMETALFCRFLGSKSKEYEQKRYRNYKNAPTNKSRVPRHKQTGQTLAANKVPIGKFTAPEP